MKKVKTAKQILRKYREGKDYSGIELKREKEMKTDFFRVFNW